MCLCVCVCALKLAVKRPWSDGFPPGNSWINRRRLQQPRSGSMYIRNSRELLEIVQSVQISSFLPNSRFYDKITRFFSSRIIPLNSPSSNFLDAR